MFDSGFSYSEDADLGINKRLVFRFIGIDENDGNRWAPGDTMDLFFVDTFNSHDEFVESPDFELAHAATLSLAAGSIALISAVLM
jgi:hypothetical protein